jgi:hypothetical protein
MLWIDERPIKGRGFKLHDRDGDSWLRIERTGGGQWDLEWVGYDAEGKAFRITERIDPWKGAEITGGTGAFVTLKRLRAHRLLSDEGPRTAKGDLELQARSYDRNGKLLFRITTRKLLISAGQVLELFGED